MQSWAAEAEGKQGETLRAQCYALNIFLAKDIGSLVRLPPSPVQDIALLPRSRRLNFTYRSSRQSYWCSWLTFLVD